MTEYAFIIDVGKCENCNNCFLACKDEHCGNDWRGYTRPQPLHGHRWMNISQVERGEFPLVDVAYLPKPCMHCENPPCVKAGGGAFVQRDDGIVLIDSDLAKGKKELISVCPYDAIWWNEEEQVVQKCTLCAHLLDDGWKKPRCVQACPTGALTFFSGEREDLAQRVAEQGLQILPEAGNIGSKPRCYYKNLYRYTHCFIAGSVAVMDQEIEECAVEARVILKNSKDDIVAEQLTDDFGDFRFDGIEADGAEYVLEISYGEKRQRVGTPAIKKSHSVGTLLMGADDGRE